MTAETVSAHGPAMVFCRTKRGADRLSQRLARSGLQSAAIHGDRSQVQRDRALAAFRSGRLDVLVATDVAARGIHVDAVPLVVHFDPPADHTDYVHRAGRTGRAGADGNVVSLITHEQRSKSGQLQRRLGISGTITSPDVRSLALVPSGPHPQDEHADRRTRMPEPAAGNTPPPRLPPKGCEAGSPGPAAQPSIDPALRTARRGAHASTSYTPTNRHVHLSLTRLTPERAVRPERDAHLARTCAWWSSSRS